MERTTTADASPREGAIPADQRTSLDQAPPEARAETGGSGPSGSQPARARWRQRGDQVAPPAWRVEGVPGKEPDKGGGRTNWSRFWLVLLAHAGRQLGPVRAPVRPGDARRRCPTRSSSPK